MAAYVISRVKIDDPDSMKSYLAEAPATVETYGGKYVVRTNAITALEGNWEHDRVVVLRFPDVEAAKAWYESPEYRPLRNRRQAASQAQIIAVPEEML